MPENDNDDKNIDKEQPLITHLLELRQRIIRCLLAVLIIFVSLIHFSNDIYQFISEPLRVYLPQGSSMIATGVASPFLAPFKLTFIVSIFMAPQ